MEDDVPTCRIHQKGMVQDGDHFVCPAPDCTYVVHIIETIPSQAELWEMYQSSEAKYSKLFRAACDVVEAKDEAIDNLKQLIDSEL